MYCAPLWPIRTDLSPRPFLSASRGCSRSAMPNVGPQDDWQWATLTGSGADKSQNVKTPSPKMGVPFYMTIVFKTGLKQDDRQGACTLVPPIAVSSTSSPGSSSSISSSSNHATQERTTLTALTLHSYRRAPSGRATRYTRARHMLLARAFFGFSRTRTEH